MKYKLITTTLAVFFLLSSIWAVSQETRDVLNAPEEPMNTIENISQNNYQYIFSGSANVPKNKTLEEKQTNLKSMACPIQEVNRTIDGGCNNIATNPTAPFGMAGIQQRRFIPDVYNANSDLVGQNRRNPREISNTVFQMNGEPRSASLSPFVFTWGQFLDHDITLTHEHDEPANIPPLPGDLIIGTFNRSEFLPGTGVNGIPREQVNSITAWIDASNVYGSDIVKANSLRTFVDGKMKTSLANNGEDILPMIGGQFEAGDVRALEQPGLTSLHILFVREHNRICCDLVACGMTDDEAIYQKARKQVGALLQSITYNEFLPALGVQLPNYTGYDNTVQPDIRNVFSTAAYRLGHTMVTDSLLLFDDFGNQTASFSLAQAFFNPSIISNNGIEGIFNGLAQQFQEEVDAKIVESLRSFLFTPSPTGPGLDLAALNIQRGRDHGLDDYNAFRVAFGIPAANNFSDITSNTTVQNQLSTAYNGDVNDIDVWVGLLAEDHLPGSSVGPTLHAILAAQFADLRDGDFYFFENDPALTATEKNIIRSTRLSDVIKRNTDINNIKADVFYGPCSYSNLSQGCVLDTGDCNCEEWEVCKNYNCIPNADPDACVCYVTLTVNNYGNCSVDLKHWLPTGDVQITNIPPGGYYSVNTHEGEKWRAKINPSGNLYFNEVYMVTGCDNQVFNVYPCQTADCPDYYHINQTINGRNSYSVSDEFTASNVLQPSANVIYTAGNRIRLLPNFRAFEGCDFHAYIAPCSVTAARMAENSVDEISEKLSLNIFPNPTENITNITFDLPKESTVNIVVFNSTGKQVAILDNNTMRDKGQHTLTFNAQQLPSGIYTVRIQTNEHSSTQKIVIAR